jgi:hypothetical protein
MVLEPQELACFKLKQSHCLQMLLIDGLCMFVDERTDVLEDIRYKIYNSEEEFRNNQREIFV